MAIRPTLNVSSPAENSKVPTSFQVKGYVSGQAHPEPLSVTSVTVQVDGGPVVKGIYWVDHTHQNPQNITWKFSASVHVTGGTDPHTIMISVETDQFGVLTLTRNVFLDVPYKISQPAIVIDLQLPGSPPDPNNEGWQSLVKKIQAGLTDLHNTLDGYGMVVAGPNLLVIPTNGLRIGVWVEDKTTFPVIPPDPNNGFPLPRVPEPGVEGGMALIPFRAYNAFVPQDALQRIAARILAMSSQQLQDNKIVNATIKVTTTTTTNEVIAVVSGTYDVALGIDFTLTYKLSLGVELGGQASGADPSRNVPKLLHSAELDVSELDEVILLALNTALAFTSPFLFVLSGAITTYLVWLAFDAVQTFNQSTTSPIDNLVKLLSTLVPLSSSQYPYDNPPEFPRFYLNWQSFGTTSDPLPGILASGFPVFDARSQDMVSIILDGPGEITNTDEELANGVWVDYTYTLANIAPDPDKLTWSVTGGLNSGGPISQTGALPGFANSFRVHLRLPAHPGGTYPFTLTVNAVETSTKDPSKVLTATASTQISVTAKHVVGPPQ